jgi:hypothetical protein
MTEIEDRIGDEVAGVFACRADTRETPVDQGDSFGRLE